MSTKLSMLSKRWMPERMQLVVGSRLVCRLGKQTKALSLGRRLACSPSLVILAKRGIYLLEESFASPSHPFDCSLHRPTLMA